MVWNKKNFSVYLERLPVQYREFVSKIGEDKGGSTEVSYLNPGCNHKSITVIGSLLQRKQFDFCIHCKSGIFISKVPLQYQQFIEYLDDLHNYYSKIKYTNPKCGCISNITMGDLESRLQFDYCNKCLTKLRKKSVEYYLSKIPDQYRSCVSYTEDLGYQTKLSVQLNCGCKQEINVSSLLAKKQFDNCGRCIPYNRLTIDNIKDSLSKYLGNIEIVDGYPGNRTTKIVGSCLFCNRKVEGYYFNLQQYYNHYQKAQCLNCMPRNLQQHELYSFIKDLGITVEEDNKSIIKYESNKYKHLDVYCKNNNFAIEYNGLLWHSEKYTNDTKYHWKKTLACLDAGITLLHVWSDKYLKHKDIYKSMVCVKLGKVKNKIHARQTQIRELTKQELLTFFENNHIDGNVPCIGGWGLFKDNVLLQAISIRAVNNQNSKYKGFLEISRSATLINFLVVGGESKLLSQIEKYAIGKFKGILNYVSCDFGGKPNPKWKFEYRGLTECSYCYTDGSKRISRQRLQNRKKNQTEKELADELGLFRVTMTPNLVYVYEFKKEEL